MKRFILFVLLVIAPFCFGQKVVVTNPAQNFLCTKISNPVDIHVEGMKCSDLTIQIDNGVIVSNGLEEDSYKGCNCTIRPEKAGNITIRILKKGKLIAQQVMRVVEFELEAKVDMPYDIDPKNKLVERAFGIRIDGKYNHLDFDSTNTLEYEFIIIRKDKVIYRNTFRDYSFNEDLKYELTKIIKGDLVLFTNMNVTLPSGEKYHLNDVVLKKE